MVELRSPERKIEPTVEQLKGDPVTEKMLVESRTPVTPPQVISGPDVFPKTSVGETSIEFHPTANPAGMQPEPETITTAGAVSRAEPKSSKVPKPAESSGERAQDHKDAGEAAPPQRMSEAELLRSLESKLQTDAAAGKFAGTVSITKDGKPIFSEALGMADRDKQTPDELETKYRIASMGKMFTAVAVMQLVQAGKIKLSDTLDKYIPDYPNKDVASRVTIEQLLTHTGGTGTSLPDKWADDHPKELKSIDDYIAHYGPISDEPKSRGEFKYSNIGFLLLGKVIEKASGQDYYGYLQEHIYEPAGMTQTGSEPEGTKVDKLSAGYTQKDGSWKPSADLQIYRGMPFGCSYSTVGDMQKFAAALMSAKLLDAEHAKVLTSGKVKLVDRPPGLPPDSKYAYGFYDATSNDGVRSIGHGGSYFGQSGDLKIYPDSGYVVTVLSNLDQPAANDISHYIDERLPAK